MCKQMSFILSGMVVALPMMAMAGEGDASSVHVVTTIKPIHALVAGVMQGVAVPELLVDGSQSPHDFQLKPSQMHTLQQAGVVVYVSDSYETFLVRALQALPADVAKIALADVKGIHALPLRSGGVWEAHDHTHEDHTDHAEHDEHEQEHETEHDHEHEQGSDQHIWLDPAHAVAITQAVADKLAVSYPRYAVTFRANAKAQVARLEALDASLEKQFAPLKDKPFLVFHDAYQYVEKRYGLQAVGSIVFEPGEALSPARIVQIKEKLRSSGAACVFTEPLISQKTMDVITEGLQVRTATLDPEAQSLTPAITLYEEMMKALAAAMRACLAQNLSL